MLDWKQVLRTNFTRIDKLADFLELNAGDRHLLLASPRFILNLPHRLAAKIQKGTLDDPILRQFVPLVDELDDRADFLADPVDDLAFKVGTKLLQKYPERSLILSTSACAMHCRYCFRQNYPYETEQRGFDKEIQAIQDNKALQEIILSGGDPLSLSNEALDALLQALGEIDHLKRIRFHTRFPVGIPERIDAGLLDLLVRVQKQIWFVIHSNHPLELDHEVLGALKKIQRLGIPVLNQAVLLKGVNDQVEVLKTLAERLANAGIAFYYLHQLDRVKGSAHFEVPLEKGLELVEELREAMSGYAVPKYVAEIPGRKSKSPLMTI